MSNFDLRYVWYRIAVSSPKISMHWSKDVRINAQGPPSKKKFYFPLIIIHKCNVPKFTNNPLKNLNFVLLKIKNL